MSAEGSHQSPRSPKDMTNKEILDVLKEGQAIAEVSGMDYVMNVIREARGRNIFPESRNQTSH